MEKQSPLVVVERTVYDTRVAADETVDVCDFHDDPGSAVIWLTMPMVCLFFLLLSMQQWIGLYVGMVNGAVVCEQSNEWCVAIDSMQWRSVFSK